MNGTCFQYKHEAEEFYARLKHRMGHFRLKLEESKSRLIKFGCFAEADCKREGTKPETFTFLVSHTTALPFIFQIMTSKSPVRSYEDVDEAALSYEN